MSYFENLWDQIESIGAVAAIVTGCIGLLQTAKNTLNTAKAERARFWLDLRTHFYRYDDVHRKLRPGGEWSNSEGPSTVDEWVQVESYMGLFEHCEKMLEQGLIDEKHFRDLYRYRLKNLVANKIIRVNKLIDCSDGWWTLLALLKKMDIEVKP